MNRRARSGLSVASALALQSGVGVLGLVAIWWADIPLYWQGMGWSAQLLYASLGAVVTYVLLLALSQLPGLFPDSLEQQMRALYQFARSYPRWALVALSVLAGVGEELLFRGAVQGWLNLYLGPWPAIVLASVLFGLVHYVSLAYCVVAAGLGLVLGAAYHLSGSLGMVMIWHALYDLIALYCLLRFPHLFGIRHGPS